jgi:hypothetical protein
MRGPIREVVQNTAGDVQPNISVTVAEVPGAALATIYNDETSATTVANPTQTDGSGRINGWLDEGFYDLTIGSDPAIIRITIVDPERGSGYSAVLAGQVFS